MLLSISTEMTSLAVVADYDFTEVFSGSIKHRTAAIEGNFAAPFLTTPFEDPAAGLSQKIVFFNTQANDMDNSFTELRVDADFGLFLQATVGYSFVKQNIETTWNFNQYYVRLDSGLTPFDQDNNDLKFDSYIVTNLFANYYFMDGKLGLSLNANNLFDEEGFTEGEEGSAVDGNFVRIRPINGRTTSLAVRYTF